MKRKADHVGRVVLDANYFANITEREIVALKARGLAVCIGGFVIGEVWARASREHKPGVIFAPLRRIAPHLDRANPILLPGGHLRRELEARSRSKRNRRAFENAYKARALLGAALAYADEAADRPERFERGGAELNRDLDAHGASWNAARRLARSEAILALQDLPESEAISQLIPLLHEYVKPPAPQRYDAYFRVAARDAVLNGRGEDSGGLDPNDADDMALLHHLAHPAFIATWDLNFLATVDKSGTYQAPWVRTLGELLTDPLPKGVPWGATAARAARDLNRRTRAELRELEKSVRVALRRE